MKTVDKGQSTLLLHVIVCIVTTEVNRVETMKTVSTLEYNSMRNMV